MYIESIQITSFASLVGFSLDLRQGLNLIEGPNEAGKSTVAEFIRYVLYGFSLKADRERYVGFSIGFNIFDLWFHKRQYE